MNLISYVVPKIILELEIIAKVELFVSRNRKRKIYKVVVCSIIMKLKCFRCKMVWEYNGKIVPMDFPQYTSCPRCKTSVKIQNENVKNN
jgi:hypothetical protein